MRNHADWETEVLTALAEHDVEAFETCLNQGMGMAGFDVDRKLNNGRTLLAAACRHGATDCVRLLLEAGSDPNITNDRGTSPLMYAKTAAFASGDLALLDLLLSYGADLHHTDKYSKNAAQYTKERANLVLSFFESKGLRAE